METLTTIDETNKGDFIQALNLNLANQPDFHKDFLVYDIILNVNPLQIVTRSCSEEQKSDRNDLLLKVFKDCKINLTFKLV